MFFARGSEKYRVCAAPSLSITDRKTLMQSLCNLCKNFQFLPSLYNRNLSLKPLYMNQIFAYYRDCNRQRLYLQRVCACPAYRRIKITICPKNQDHSTIKSILQLVRNGHFRFTLTKNLAGSSYTEQFMMSSFSQNDLHTL